MASAALFIALTLLYVDVTSGLLRYALNLVGLPFVFYLPFIACIAFLIAYYSLETMRARVVAIATIAVTFLSVFVAILLGRGAAQTFFAAYSWAPFFLGITLARMGLGQRLLRHAPALWVIAVIGVALNYYVEFPWTGSAYKVLGFEVLAAKKWQAYEFERLAGFSRASFTAANQIAILGCLLLAVRGHLLTKIAVWGLSILTIALTTSKAPLLMMIVVPASLLVCKVASVFAARGADARVATRPVVLALIASVVLLPLGQDIGAYFNADARVSFFNLSSVAERIELTWPRAFALLQIDGNPVEWILGRGLGGIGVGQQFAEGAVLNPADNMFVFLYVTFGLGSLLILLLLYRGFERARRTGGPEFDGIFVSTISVLTLGSMSNIIESVLPCLLLGLICGMALVSRRGVLFRSEKASRQGARFAHPSPR